MSDGTGKQVFLVVLHDDSNWVALAEIRQALPLDLGSAHNLAHSFSDIYVVQDSKRHIKKENT